MEADHPAGSVFLIVALGGGVATLLYITGIIPPKEQSEGTDKMNAGLHKAGEQLKQMRTCLHSVFARKKKED
jgi:hypothetical protein